MSASTTRMFRPSRVVALGLTALLIGSVVYLRFAPDSDTVSVPEGAMAGDLGKPQTMERLSRPFRLTVPPEKPNAPGDR